MDKITLKLGVPYQGKRYKTATINLLTIGGECQAQELIADLGLAKDELSKTEQRLVDMAYLCQQVSIYGIPQKAFTPQFLFDNLPTDDYWQIIEAQLELRKKLSGDGESLNPSEV